MMTATFFILVTALTKVISMLTGISFLALFILSPLTWFVGFMLIVIAVRFAWSKLNGQGNGELRPSLRY